MKLSDRKTHIPFSKHLRIAGEFEDQNRSAEAEENARQTWNELSDNESASENHMNSYYKVFHQIHQEKQIRLKQIRKTIMRYASVAAVLIAAIWGGSQLFIQQPQSSTEQAIRIDSPEGVRTRFYLPDGSNGWLNSGSSLSFSMNKNIRTAELKGEAFFDVKKLDGKAFDVHTPHFKVHVLGTRFNVYSYPDEDISEVVLESGSVAIENNENLKRQTIKPGQCYTYQNISKTDQLSLANVAGSLAWTEGRIFFNNEPLRELIPKIERFYHIDMVVSQKELLDYPFYGELTNEPVENLLELMQLAMPMNYTIEKRIQNNNGKFEKRKVVLHLKK